MKNRGLSLTKMIEDVREGAWHDWCRRANTFGFAGLINHLARNFARLQPLTRTPLRIPRERDDGCRPRVAKLEGKQVPYGSSPLPCTKDIGRYVIRCIATRPQTSCIVPQRRSTRSVRAHPLRVSRDVSCR